MTSCYRILEVVDVAKPRAGDARKEESGRVLDILLEEDDDEGGHQTQDRKRCLKLIMESVLDGSIHVALELVQLPFVPKPGDRITIDRSCLQKQNVMLLMPGNCRLSAGNEHANANVTRAVDQALSMDGLTDFDLSDIQMSEIDL